MAEEVAMASTSSEVERLCDSGVYCCVMQKKVYSIYVVTIYFPKSFLPRIWS